MSYQEERLRDIAEAIREKGGTTKLITANDFAAAIRSLPEGSGDTPEPSAEGIVLNSTVLTANNIIEHSPSFSVTGGMI